MEVILDAIIDMLMCYGQTTIEGDTDFFHMVGKGSIFMDARLVTMGRFGVKWSRVHMVGTTTMEMFFMLSAVHIGIQSANVIKAVVESVACNPRYMPMKSGNESLPKTFDDSKHVLEID